MRIMLLCRSLDIGGTQRQIVELARGLQNRGHRVTVVTFYDGGALRPLLDSAKVPSISLGKSGRWDLLRFLWRFRRVVRHVRPEVVYSFLAVPNLMALIAPLFGRGTRVAWGIRASKLDLSRYGGLLAWSYRIERRFAGFADVIIANSVAGATDARAAFHPAARLDVVPNGIDTIRFRPDPEAGAGQRAAWDVTPQERLVGLVGRLDPMKGISVFLAAAAQLKADPLLVFAVIGDGPAENGATLRREAERLGLADRMLWRPPGPEVTALYNALDVLVSPSLFGEGFSNVIAEAMACGTPVVATTVGDAATIVGSCGTVVEPGDPVALAVAIRRELSRSADDRAASRRHIEATYSTAALAEATERLLTI